MLPLPSFTHATTLKQIGYARLTRFFNEFIGDLEKAGLSLPEYCASNDEYFVALAALLASPGFPERPRGALGRLEFLVAPANIGRFDAEMEQRLPSVHFPRSAPAVDRALELWFCDRDATTDLWVSLEDAAKEHPTSNNQAPSRGRHNF
jgi:hypothetical protein